MESQSNPLITSVRLPPAKNTARVWKPAEKTAGKGFLCGFPISRGLYLASHVRSGATIQLRQRGTGGSVNTTTHRDPHFGVLGGANEMSTWIHSTDTRGQITNARKRLDEAAGAPFAPGWGASYVYDDIGNRVAWSQGSAQQTNLGDLEPAACTTSALNQYTSISSVNAAHITGQAPAAREVKWEVRSDARFTYDGWNVVAEIETKGDAETKRRLTCNQFLNCVGNPTQVEADIGIIYREGGLAAALTWIRQHLEPLFLKQEANHARR